MKTYTHTHAHAHAHTHVGTHTSFSQFYFGKIINLYNRDKNTQKKLNQFRVVEALGLQGKQPPVNL